MITAKIGDRPIQSAYELLARCKFLTLVGQDEDGELEWIGTLGHWAQVQGFEQDVERYGGYQIK